MKDRDATTASIALVGSEGRNLGHLAWTPEKPGYNLLRFQLPPLGLLLLALAACTSLVVRNARKSTMALEESARMLEASAQTVKESEARFRDVAEASSDWIWECDPYLRMTYFSSRFSEVTGIAPACVLGKTIEQFFSSEADPEGWTDFIAGTHGRHAFRDLRCAYRDSNGEPRICRLAGRPIRDADGAFVGFRGTATDITEEVLANARANHLALHDALTGLPNRVLFQEKLDFALNGPRRNAKQIAVLFLDLDHFKEVNDTLGHGAGDILLRQLAERLKSCARSNDLVARLGGDEFAIIMADVTEPSEAEALSRRIIEVTKTPFRIDAQDLFIGVSIGIAFPQEANYVPERLLKNADIALYRAKQSGRGTTCFFEAKMDIELKERKALENDLRQSIFSDELELHYQPIIDIRQNRVCGVEALVRWKHSERGMVSPGTFIPLAEETGLVMAIDDWVLQEACRQATEWENLQVAVNLSSVQFRHRELVSKVQHVLETTGLEPHLLELEVTEGVLINDTEAALEVLTSLKGLGVRIAMDDFGTGYSSLGYLNAFPFDKIKIDRSFVSGLGESGKSNAIVKSVLRLGDSLQMVTTAEGVETGEQVEFLRAEGCQQIQGFYFAPPVPTHELCELLASDLSSLPRKFVSAA